MADQLSDGLLARLKDRAGNAERRSDDNEMAANSQSMDEMFDSVPKSDDPAVREYLEGMNTPFAGMIANMVTGDGSQAKGLLGMLGGAARRQANVRGGRPEPRQSRRSILDRRVA